MAVGAFSATRLQPATPLPSAPVISRQALEKGKIDAVVMKARRLIEASTFQPETLAVLFKAFDDAWSEFEPHLAGDEAATEQARLRLAHAVLILAREDDDDPEKVKNDALQVMALAAPRRG